MKEELISVVQPFLFSVALSQVRIILDAHLVQFDRLKQVLLEISTMPDTVEGAEAAREAAKKALRSVE